MKNKKMAGFIVFFCALFLFEGQPSAKQRSLVDVKEIVPSILIDIRYFGPHNFVGKKIDGYEAPKCLLTIEAADALKKIQDELESSSMTLKLYDCYRPTRAVANFVRWAKDANDTKMKKEFYEEVDKKDLFAQGYIAEKSSHSRGSTVDLTIVKLPPAKEETYKDGDDLRDCRAPQKERFGDNSIDMGTGFDCFSVLSHTENPSMSREQKKNRKLLKALMEKYGFVNLKEEWWHYTLKNEPYPDTYFDVEVK